MLSASRWCEEGLAGAKEEGEGPVTTLLASRVCACSSPLTLCDGSSDSGGVCV